MKETNRKKYNINLEYQLKLDLSIEVSTSPIEHSVSFFNLNKPLAYNINHKYVLLLMKHQNGIN